MTHPASDQDAAAGRRSRRQLLAGGAAGALGAIGLEALTSTTPAQAAEGSATTTTVTEVLAGDKSITIKGTATEPKVATGSLDKIATLHPPLAPVTFNAHKGINIANGSAPTDVAAFGQLPSAAAPLPLTEGGTGVSESSAGALLTALGALPEAGGALTGGLAPTVVALSQSGGSVVVNASQGNVFTITLTASGWTIATPVSPVGDGQIIRFRLIQDSTGGRTVSWGTGYDWGSTGGNGNGPVTLSTTAGATDILGFEYIAALSAWCFLAAPFPQGF